MAKKRPKRTPSRVVTDVVETRSLVLVDEFGQPRLEASCVGGESGVGGHVVLTLLGDGGRQRISLQVSEDEVSVALSASNNTPSLTLVVHPSGANGIGVADQQGIPVIEIGVPAPGRDPRGDHANVHIHDSTRKRIWSALE